MYNITIVLYSIDILSEKRKRTLFFMVLCGYKNSFHPSWNNSCIFSPKMTFKCKNIVIKIDKLTLIYFAWLEYFSNSIEILTQYFLYKFFCKEIKTTIMKRKNKRYKIANIFLRIFRNFIKINNFIYFFIENQ